MSKVTAAPKLIERLYKLFSIRLRSEKEIRDYFRAKNYKLKIKDQEQISTSLINSVIQKLKEQKLLDDQEFARAWMEARSKKYGKNRIKQELFQKGIDREIINEVIEDGENSEQIAKVALEKKLRVWRQGLPTLEFKKKAYEFLLRRGFEYEIVKSVVEKYIKKGYN